MIGELLPNGRYAYPIVVLEEPRQTGKTSGITDLLLGRSLMYRDYRCAYTAQTGHIVSERFIEWIDELERIGLLEPRIKTRRSGGTERITVRATRSFLRAFPPKDGALRSAALDAVVVDEAQEHDDVLGAALDRTIIPTMTTRPRRQLIVTGTAGTDASTYFARYVKAARAGTPGYAWFSYGAPEGVDPLVEDLWDTWHPGLMSGITDVDALRLALSILGPAGFTREYGTIWTRVSLRAIDPEKWRAAQHREDMPPGRLCLGVDAAADRSSAAITIAGPGRHVELVEVADGTDWTAGRARALQERTGAPIAIDNVGPVATVKDELARAGATLLTMGAQDVANAAAGVMDKINDGTLRVWPHPALDEAVEAAATRPLGGDGGFGWSRRNSAGSIAPLVALSAALWGWEHLPPPPTRPAVYAA